MTSNYNREWNLSYNPTDLAFFFAFPVGCDHYGCTACMCEKTSCWFIGGNFAQAIPFRICENTICYCKVVLYRTARTRSCCYMPRYSMGFVDNTINFPTSIHTQLLPIFGQLRVGLYILYFGSLVWRFGQARYSCY